MNEPSHNVTLLVPDLEYVAEFVPWSKSRNAGEKEPSLNWRVTFKTPRGSITVDYMAGCGHCPSYKQGRLTVDEKRVIDWECEYGRAGTLLAGGVVVVRNAKPILPDPADVLHCLLMDAEAIDYPTFEDWASSTGYETDSRKAEAIYNACMITGLKLRIMFGDDTVTKLREVLADL